MNNLSSRPTRSRVSNNFVAGTKVKSIEVTETKRGNSGLSQAFLDGWVEPVVPPQRPSYADAGIERHGVVQNMAPLGSRPSMRVLKAAALLEGADSLVRPMGSRKTEVADSSIPVGPGIKLKSSEFPFIDTSETAVETQRDNKVFFQTIEKTGSLSQTFQEQISPKSSSAPIQIPKQPHNPMNEQKQAINAIDIINLDSEIARREFSQSPVVPPATGQDGLPLINLAQTDRVVELAVQNAVDRKRWPTAYALRTLYDDNRGDISFVRLLEAVYYKYATEKDLDEFERLLKPRKHEGKKDCTGEIYFNSDGSESATRRPIFSAIEALNPPAPAYVTPYNSLPPYESSPANIEFPKSKCKSPTITDTLITQSSSPESRHKHKKPRTTSYPGNNCIKTVQTANVISTGIKSPLPVSEGQFKLKSRSYSRSSSSSLSSVDMNLISEVSVSPKGSVSNHGLARLGLFGAQPVFVSPYASVNNFKEAASSADSEARSRAKPISLTSKSGPKIHTFAVAPSSNNIMGTRSKLASLPPSRKSPTASASIINEPPNSDMSSNSSRKRNSKTEMTASFDVNDERSTKRRKAKEFTNNSTIANVTESFERISSKFSPNLKKSTPVLENEELIATTAYPPAKRPQKIRLNHNTCYKNSFDSECNSPTEAGFRKDFASFSLPSPRACTPLNNARQVIKNKTVTGLRVKSSPMKKKTGISAGIPKAASDYNSPLRNSNPGNNDENDDFCASCGGNGEVVCCDGDTCKRSFHFKCVDPPIMPDALPETWFCNECRVKQIGHQEENSGLFALLLLQLEEKNPSAFSLPLEIRRYFEGVRTGPDGEYEEIMVSKPKWVLNEISFYEANKSRPINRAGWEEAPDYFRKRDNKGRPILCHGCGLQAEAPSRVIIPCSFCGLYWHLDCLDMPLAKEPAPGRLWQCQAHVDDLLRFIPSSLAPAHRFRKIQGSAIIQPGFPSGFKNHGHIEIENENETTGNGVESQLGFYEERPFGRITKITEQSIKLDFLLKAKRDGGGYTRARFSESRKKKLRTWSEANLSDQQAALNLIALANSDPSLKGLNNLISTLLAEAPPDVIKMIAQGDAETLASDQTQLKPSDKKSLMALKIYISKKLNCLDENESEASTRKMCRT